MKIGFVLDDTLDSTDGVQQYVLFIGEWLTTQGHQVHYLVGQTSRTDVPHIHSLSRNISVRFNGNRMTIPRPASRADIRRLLATESFDVLHVQMPYSPWLAGRVIDAAPASTALLATFHIAPHSRMVTTATKALALYTGRQTKRLQTILCVSQAAQKFLKTTYHQSGRILPNVVNVARFRTAKPMALPTNVPIILFLGRLVQRKGCQLLLEAVSLLKDQSPNMQFRVIICGRGPLEPELRAYATAHSLDEYVEFVGYISEDDKPKYLKLADIAVFPSSGGESFGIVLLEAMAAHHPIVLAAENDGYKAVLQDYPDALFPVGDANALKLKLKTLLNGIAAARELAAWQDSYVDTFDTNIVGTKLLDVYEKIIAENHG